MNVLHIISDQHLATCMGVEGHPQAITPNMNRLAQGGVRFARAYTQNPICTPSRTSILSGQYCHNHGYYGLSGPMPEKLPSYLSHFKSHGYRTAGIGKLHTPNEPRDWLRDHCDLYAECYEYGKNPDSGDANSAGSPYFAYLEKLGLRDREDSVALTELPGAQQNEGRPSHLPYRHSVEGWCVQTATEFMAACQGAPFCMQVSLPRPHQCYTPDRKFWEMYPEDLELPATIYNDASHRPPHFQSFANWFRSGRGLFEPDDFESWARRIWRGYLACVTQVDYALGELLDFLDENGLAQNTVVIYNSDHGAYSGSFGIPEKAPGICSEAVCRVPFLWRVPGVTVPGYTSGLLVENVDIAPTITSLCELPPMDSVDGKDISSLLRGGSEGVRQVAVTENAWSKSLRWKQWRFVHYQPEMFGQDIGELYDIEADPHETRNLYGDAEYSEVVNGCRRLLLEWLIGTTRVTTSHPKPADGYDFAGDGKQGANNNPSAVNARGGWALNYI